MKELWFDLAHRLPSAGTIIGAAGVAATLALGILGIVATTLPDKLVPVSVSMVALSFTTLLLFVLSLSLRRGNPWKIPEPPYKTKSSLIHWDIVSPDGDLAYCEKTKAIEFVQDNVISLRDFVRTDGNPPEIGDMEVSADRCQPSVVQIHQDGDEWDILIALNATFHRGDKLTLSLRRKTVDAFRDPQEEYVQPRVPEQTRQLTAMVTLPPGRYVKDGTLELRIGRGQWEARPQRLSTQRHVMVDSKTNRQQIIWTQQRPVVDRTYRLSWQWSETVPGQGTN